MPRRQGIRRLNQGIVRRLTPHELKRGYIFISNDKHLSEVLDIENFEVEIAGRLYSSRRIDVSGRVHIPLVFLRTIGAEQKIQIDLVSQKKVRMKLLQPERIKRANEYGST